MNVVVEPDVHDAFARIPGFGFIQTFYYQDTRYFLHLIINPIPNNAKALIFEVEITLKGPHSINIGNKW